MNIEKRVKELEDRLQEVLREKDEEEKLRREIILRKYELKEEEIEELRKQALPFLDQEEETVKELLLLVQGVRLKLEELQELQVKIMSFRGRYKYEIPSSLRRGVKYLLSHFETHFPELLGLSPGLSIAERKIQGARDRVKYLEDRLQETKKKNLESGHRFEREVEEAEERVRGARARVQFLTQ